MTTPRGPQPFPGQEKRLRLLAFVRQDSVVRVDKRVEDTAMVWPHLLVIEFIAAMLWFIGLFVISAAFNAPLQDHSTPDCTPNPSKAPWYLLNLQELLLHMDKGLAGVIVPTIWIVFMMAIPYIDRSREGVGIWFTAPRGLRVTYFAAAYATVLTFSLIVLDKLLKDHGYIEFASQNLPGGKILGRIKRRQLLRLGFLTGTLLALGELTALLYPFFKPNKIVGLGAKVPVGSKDAVMAQFQAAQDAPILNTAGKFFLLHPEG